jgi:hypothetical protein
MKYCKDDGTELIEVLTGKFDEETGEPDRTMACPKHMPICYSNKGRYLGHDFESSINVGFFSGLRETEICKRCGLKKETRYEPL